MKGREIKFRAWGKNSQEFLQDGKGYGLTLKEIQNIHDIDVWELSQFTGLKDKNGKEIYEGDILQMENGLGERQEKIKGHVVFDRGAFRVRRGSTDPMASKVGRSEQNLWSFTKRHVVIGNIYENPELLTK